MISLIGGSGFIGNAIATVLSRQGLEFEILDLVPSKLYPKASKIVDIRKYENLYENLTGDLVINLAAVHADNVGNYEAYYSTNVKGAKNLIKVCAQKNITKLIFTSTVAVYGFAKPNIDETGEIKPFNSYGKTKYLAECVYKDWHKNKQGSLFIIRPTVVFGPGNRGNVFNLFRQIRSGYFCMVGSGTNKKSMAYVENLAEFIVFLAFQNWKFEISNYIDKPDYSMKELVRLVSTISMGKDKSKFYVPQSLGYLIGIAFDALACLTRMKFPISQVRIKKFCSVTTFKSSNSFNNNFNPKHSLKDGIIHTLKSDFSD